MIESFIELLLAGLSIWDHKLATKYVDLATDLKEQWYAEYEKPESYRSNAVLDAIDLKLRLLAASFAAEIRGQKA